MYIYTDHLYSNLKQNNSPAQVTSSKAKCYRFVAIGVNGLSIAGSLAQDYIFNPTFALYVLLYPIGSRKIFHGIQETAHGTQVTALDTLISLLSYL